MNNSQQEELDYSRNWLFTWIKHCIGIGVWVKYLESPFSNEEKLLPQCSLNSLQRLPGLDILGGRNYRNRHEWHWRKFPWKVFGKSKNCSDFEMQTIQTNPFSSNFRANPRFLIFTRSVRLSKRPIIRYIYVRSVNVVINHAIWVRLYPDFNFYVFRHALVLFVIRIIGLDELGQIFVARLVL